VLPSSPLQIFFYFPQPLQLFLQVLHSLQNILALGIVLRFLSIEKKMFHSFREQRFGIHVHPMQAQHPLAGDGVVFVPVDRVIWMRVDNFFVRLLKGQKKGGHTHKLIERRRPTALNSASKKPVKEQMLFRCPSPESEHFCNSVFAMRRAIA